ncbi:inositol monophosphatase family protein [Bacteriovoracaceae bacterium]|nr:inositol monophosphatase family protein [Bacteriovoracaceae bacterium]
MKKNEQRLVLQGMNDIATLAGDKLERYQKKLSKLQVTHKDAQGVVSEADINTEKFIIKNLRKIFPMADVLGEEDYYVQNKKNTGWENFKSKEWLWIIDPLDGTSNFLSGLEFYCVCICLAHYGKPKLAVIYWPNKKKSYLAIDGEGSSILDRTTRKKKVLKIKDNKKVLRDSLVVTGFAAEKGEPFDKEFDLFKNVMAKARGVRRLGSAALDMCLVSEGLFGAFWERGLAPWDMAAAGLIAKESGLRVGTYQNKKFCPFEETICVGTKKTYPELITILKS